MTDRELLEAAAKAAGMEYAWEQNRGAKSGWLRARLPGSGDAFPVWNPLTNDGDAFRLAVKLGFTIEHCTGTREVEVSLTYSDSPIAHEFYADDSDDARECATRRAIVLAAAQMGLQGG